MDQFLDTFLNWEYIWQVFPDLLKTGLLNTLILAGVSAVIGTVLGMILAVMGLSTKRWLRWPARVYTDIFRGLPAILTILVIGQGLGTVARDVVGTNPYPLGILALLSLRPLTLVRFSVLGFRVLRRGSSRLVVLWG